MAANPLLVAHNTAQARKAAAGAPTVYDVATGEAKPKLAKECAVFLVGTDLTLEQVFDVALQVVDGLLWILASERSEVGVHEALLIAYMDGVLAGIEHGRNLEPTMRGEA